jgi:hypothetical protein
VELATIQDLEQGRPTALNVRQALDRALELDGLLAGINQPPTCQSPSPRANKTWLFVHQLRLTNTSWYSIFGACAGAMSLFSLCHHIIHIHVYTFFLEILGYYHHFFYWFADPLRTALANVSTFVFGRPLFVPRDILVIYILGLGCAIRGYRKLIRTESRNTKYVDFINIFGVFAILIWPIFVANDIRLSIKDDDYGNNLSYREKIIYFATDPPPHYLGEEFIGEAVKMTSLFLVFVAVNACGPSLFG